MTHPAPRWTPATVKNARANIRGRVGAFFRNTIWAPRTTCAVCAHPVANYPRCFRCNQARQNYEPVLADLVMPLAYAYRRSDAAIASQGRHQSHQHMWSYKEPQPGPGCVTDLTLMLLLALQWHQNCAEAKVGRPWDVWAVVPSSRHTRSQDHPLVDMAIKAGLGGTVAGLPVDRTGLVLQGHPSQDREVRPDRFVVPQPASAAGRHVLLLEDTWVTGASAQSAALALKRAGASAVTIICLARWIREDTAQPDCGAFFDSLEAPYDPLSCPVHGGEPCVGPFS